LQSQVDDQSKTRAATRPYSSDMQTLLFTLGLVLFLIGLLTGFAVPTLKNPRMALSSHLEAILNGMFLVLLGLLWPYIHLPHAWAVVAVVLIVYSAYANWLATLLAAAWGAGRKLAPIAAADHQASTTKEQIVSFLLVSLSASIVVGVGIVIFGL
jgi:hydroxylaminobenzene mutase